MSSQDIEAARRFYSRISRVYDALADADEHRARELGLQLLDAKPGERILEVGFGTGTALVDLARAVAPGGRIIGVDVAEGMKDVALRRLSAEGMDGRVELRIAAVPPLPLDDARCDGAFLSFTLELFPDDTVGDVLAEITRVLTPDGRLVVVAMDTGAAGHHHHLAERTYQWMHLHFPHIVDCRAIDGARCLTAAGFTIERREQLEIWGLPVAIIRAYRASA
jgi:ubiquinone/menaquinone biosynthesis C-methylase UbiE